MTQPQVHEALNFRDTRHPRQENQKTLSFKRIITQTTTAMARMLGSLDLCITMTLNPEFTELNFMKHQMDTQATFSYYSLPHCHCLVFFKNGDKVTSTERNKSSRLREIAFCARSKSKNNNKNNIHNC